MLWRYNPDAFGYYDAAATGSTIIDRINLRFPGQYYDEYSGLYYNHNRYYNPQLGRYMEPDPIGLEGGLNPYAYASNDPVNLTDPSGLCPMCVGAGFGAAGYLVPMTYNALRDKEGVRAHFSKNFYWRELGMASAIGAVTGGVTNRVLESNGVILNYGKQLFKDFKPFQFTQTLNKLPPKAQQMLNNQIRTWTNPGGVAVKAASSVAGNNANSLYEQYRPTIDSSFSRITNQLTQNMLNQNTFGKFISPEPQHTFEPSVTITPSPDCIGGCR